MDLNGKKYAWQGVALLPFVDEKRLHAALEQVYPDLTNEESEFPFILLSSDDFVTHLLQTFLMYCFFHYSIIRVVHIVSNQHGRQFGCQHSNHWAIHFPTLC